MENEIKQATTVREINSILEKWVGQYDLDIAVLVLANISFHARKDVYYISTSKDLDEVKSLLVKSIKYR